ncbi:hypothetical protein [Lysinibacillus fusiformis]|uniref:hypothetical protein n=1 Tax=Lysinibacillus fusiformis TaxID=28031 RepID=UPI001587065C|nr:hypothetical protein [Lysinibacillus fusiformis]
MSYIHAAISISKAAVQCLESKVLVEFDDSLHGYYLFFKGAVLSFSEEAFN